MAAQSPPFALQNGSHSAALFRQAVYSMVDRGGVLATTDLVVSAQGTPNMSVSVSAGQAWIPGSQVANVPGGSWSTQAAYFGVNDAPVSVTIGTANATNPRIDTIYIAVNDQAYSGSLNGLVIGVVAGTPAASPVAPAAPANSLVLAAVAVAANATSIVSGNIAAAAGLMTVALGGIRPATATDNTVGSRTGDYRDHPTKGLQRWVAADSAWETPTQQKPLCQVKQDTAQLIPLSAWTAIQFNNETVDTDGMHSNSVNNTRVTCTVAGTYSICGTVVFDGPPGSSTVRIGARLLKNGAVIDMGGAFSSITAPLVGCTATTPTITVTLAVGDYIELDAWQEFSSIGGGLTTHVTVDQRSSLSVTCVRLT